MSAAPGQERDNRDLVSDWEPTDYDAMARVYDAGRAMPAERVTEWRDAMSAYLAELTHPVADVGSGTGIWAFFMAEWFDADVIGIEPSDGMRQRATQSRSHDRISYVGGAAEHLPLRNGSCGAVWMSTVIHHISDLESAAREARRVIREGGPLLIRQGFSGRHEEIPWCKVFPSAAAIAEERHTRLEVVVETFVEAGFELEGVRRAHEVIADDVDEYIVKVSTRSDSSLTLIRDEEFEAGLAELKKMAKDAPPEPVIAGLDLVILR